MSQSASATAAVAVVFNADGTATLTSSKGISHYVVTLCDGTTFKVELSGEDRTKTIGPFSSPIAGVGVKSATTFETTTNPAGCEVKPPPPPPPPPPPCDPKYDPKCEPPK